MINILSISIDFIKKLMINILAFDTYFHAPKIKKRIFANMDRKIFELKI